MIQDKLDGGETIVLASEDDAEEQREIEALLSFLHRERGLDFSGHKRPSLVRRIRRRMVIVGVSSIAEYLAFLQRHDEEPSRLFDVLLINVTAFFRDLPAWQALGEKISNIVDPTGEAPIRVWSAGCSSGEEPYTLAMVLCEALGAEVFSRRVKIYATDIDEDALAHARQGIYSSEAIESVPTAFVDKYFTPSGPSAFVFDRELRREVVFGRHDLVQDAPIPHIDLLACRNALMYFNSEVQESVFQRLQFALKPNGVLFLGRAELVPRHAAQFSPLDLKLRLFSRALPLPRPQSRAVLQTTSRSNSLGNRDNDVTEELCRAAFVTSPAAQIAIDAAGRLLLVNDEAARIFAIPKADVGRPFEELEVSLRPVLLRSSIEKARLERRSVHHKEVERVLMTGEKTFLDIEVSPLLSDTGLFVGTQASFVDVTPTRRLQVELRRANLELEATESELRSTSRELAASNGELNSVSQELETTNEELQAINEELARMNEELQSTNEELQTINEELRQRGTELNEMRAFFDAVLSSFRFGVAVLDGELRVQAWSSKMTQLLGTLPAQVRGKNIANVDLGLPAEMIAAALRAGSAGQERDHTLDFTSSRGKKLSGTVSMLPMNQSQATGLIVLLEEVS